MSVQELSMLKSQVRNSVSTTRTVAAPQSEKSSLTFLRIVQSIFSSSARIANKLIKSAEAYLAEAQAAEKVGGFLDAAKSYQKAAEKMNEANSADSSPSLKAKAESLFYHAIINYSKRLQLFELSLKSQMELCTELAKCHSALGMKDSAVQYSREAYALNSQLNSTNITPVRSSIPPAQREEKREIHASLTICYLEVGDKASAAKYSAPRDEWDSFSAAA